MSADRPGRAPKARNTPVRALLTGWFSFLHGEATAGDVLAAQAVAAALDRAGIPYRMAWSPAFRPEALHLDDADPAAFTHVVFVCGPLHSDAPAGGDPAPLLALHRRFARCRRIAVGTSVLDPEDPTVTGFHRVLARDGTGKPPRPDLALAAPRPPLTPLAGVILTDGQGEYGKRRRHAAVNDVLTGWLRGLDAARLPLDTRLDSRDWRLAATPGQLHSVLARLDAVVTTRLHGMVLALQAGVPALAVDPVAGGAKVTAQAAALDWPAVLPAEELDERHLDTWWRWCLAPRGRTRAAHCAARASARDDGLLSALLSCLDSDCPDGDR